MHPAKIELENSRWLFIGAIAFFILAKFAFIFLPINALGMPRLGDDALYYLWGGKQILQGYDTSKPALADILMQHGLDDNPSIQSQRLRSRVHFRTIGTHSPFYDLMMAAILATGLSLKWAFAVSEAIIAVVMGLGIAFFFRILFGPTAAALGLVLLAFLILPIIKGLHYFIPAVLTLSCALMIWTYLLRSGEKANPTIALMAGFFLLGLHPIARIYLFIGVVAWLLTIGPSSRWWQRNVIIITVGLGLLTIAAHLLPNIVPILGHEAAGEQRRLDFGNGMVENLLGAANQLRVTASQAWGILILALAAPFVVGRGIALSRPVIAMTGAISIPLLVSLFYYYPGYPAEIFGRLLVPLTAILAGIAAVGLASFLARERTLAMRTVAGIFALLFIAYSIESWYQKVFINLNSRVEIIDEKAVAEQLNQLPAGTTVAYLEPDVTLTSSLLLGGTRYGALVVPLLIGTDSLKALIQEKKPTHAVLPVPGYLNMETTRRSRNLSKRRNGFPFRLTSKLIIDAGKRFLPDVYIWVSNPNDFAVVLTIHENPTSPSPKSPGRTMTVPSGRSGWVRIDTSAVVSRSILVGLPHQAGWIEGISIGPPREHIRWPWGSDIRVATLARGSQNLRFALAPLNIPALLKAAHLAPLISLIRRENPVLSDDSGFVFLNTIFSQEK